MKALLKINLQFCGEDEAIINLPRNASIKTIEEEFQKIWNITYDESICQYSLLVPPTNINPVVPCARYVEIASKMADDIIALKESSEGHYTDNQKAKYFEKKYGMTLDELTAIHVVNKIKEQDVY